MKRFEKKKHYLLLLLAAGSNLFATTISIPGLCNTGLNAGCISTIALGATDPNWLLDGAAVDVAQHGTWLPNDSTSGWLGVSSFSALGGFYNYSTTFTIPAAYVPALTVIGGRYSSDNELVSVLLNGIPVSPFPYNGPTDFNNWTPFLIDSSTATFAAGANTLTFQVRNRGVGGDPNDPTALGFRAEFTSATLSDAPEPGTYFLSASALIGLAWIKRRRGPS